jgi:predicted RNase H-like nuclease
MTWVAGVDACRGGWFVVLRDHVSGETRHRLVEHLHDVVIGLEKPPFVAVDIPIGLLEHAVRGGRGCDQEARSLLGPPRGRSVFSPPVRAALRCADYAAANRANKTSSPDKIGISRQSFGLSEKMREADEFTTPELQPPVCEVHPELCFYQLNGRQPMKHSKKKREGLLERRSVLVKAGFAVVISAIGQYPRTKVAEDDILDACVACWTAERILNEQAICIPAEPPLDGRGLQMKMSR